MWECGLQIKREEMVHRWLAQPDDASWSKSSHAETGHGMPSETLTHLASELHLGELQHERHALVADLEHDVGVARPRDVDVQAHLLCRGVVI